jgi:hypothetical protein
MCSDYPDDINGEESWSDYSDEGSISGNDEDSIDYD